MQENLGFREYVGRRLVVVGFGVATLGMGGIATNSYALCENYMAAQDSGNDIGQKIAYKENLESLSEFAFLAATGLIVAGRSSRLTRRQDSTVLDGPSEVASEAANAK